MSRSYKTDYFEINLYVYHCHNFCCDLFVGFSIWEAETGGTSQSWRGNTIFLSEY
jgi:hypothetical protein